MNGDGKIVITSLTDLLRKLPDEASCEQYLEQIVGIRCPYCYAKYRSRGSLKKKDKYYKCSALSCRRLFNIFTGTEFEHTHIPFRKWLILIFLFLFNDKELNTHELARDLGITQKTAWKMLQKIKKAHENDYRKSMFEKNKEKFSLDKNIYNAKLKD